MWKTTQLGSATWEDSYGELAMDAPGGSEGISVGSTKEPLSLQLGAVDDQPLPTAGEHFVQSNGPDSSNGSGDRWHINYPQGDARFALRLALQVIQSNADRLVLEICVSVQTDLWDSHPKLDLRVDCQRIESMVPQDEFGKDDVQGPGSASISTALSKDHSMAILLGTHDQPFTTNHSTDRTLRLRLFGEFLERGVIRRARPWLVIDRAARSRDSDLEGLWNDLCRSPLPLS